MEDFETRAVLKYDLTGTVIEPYKKSKLIEESLYWAELLVKEANNDQMNFSHKKVFKSIYNLALIVCVNKT